MNTNNPETLSKFLSVVRLLGAAIWSIMQMFSWIISSVVGYLLTTYEACHAINLKKSSQEVIHNLINYPDEVSINS